MNCKIGFAGTIFVSSLNENWRLYFNVLVVFGLIFSSRSNYSPPIPSSTYLSVVTELPLDAFLFLLPTKTARQ